MGVSCLVPAFVKNWFGKKKAKVEPDWAAAIKIVEENAPAFLKQERDRCLRQSPLLLGLEEHGQIKYRETGKNLTWRIKSVARELPRGKFDFPVANTYREASLPWRSVQTGTKPVGARTPAEFLDEVEDILRGLLRDAFARLRYSVYYRECPQCSLSSDVTGLGSLFEAPFYASSDRFRDDVTVGLPQRRHYYTFQPSRARYAGVQFEPERAGAKFPVSLVYNTNATWESPQICRAVLSAALDWAQAHADRVPDLFLLSKTLHGQAVAGLPRHSQTVQDVPIVCDKAIPPGYGYGLCWDAVQLWSMQPGLVGLTYVMTAPGGRPTDVGLEFYCNLAIIKPWEIIQLTPPRKTV